MTDMYDLMERIEKRIAELPNGYISKKTINDKTQYYRQWKEDGKLKSKYISAKDVETVREQIEERKKLEEKLKDLQFKYPKDVSEEIGFETNVVYGQELSKLVSSVKSMQKRDAYARLQKYVYGDDRTRVCAVYGLRRTGKTTMLLQTIADMSEEDFSKTVYIKFKTSDTMDMIDRDLNKLSNADYKYVFMDEVTLMEDFIDTAAVFSDIYVGMGMKIVMSGTDSLGFEFASENELYDRVRMIHTTYIPFREYSRLLGIDSIDEYIRYGGTLRMGETDFDDEDLNAEDASFRDDESTRRYIDTAICRNIQHSLRCYKYGKYFGHLYELYESGELTGAINRIMEDMNHRFVLEVLTNDFKSHDLGITAGNLRRERNPEKRIDIMAIIDKEDVTKRLMDILDIRNRENQTIEIRPSHIEKIKQYLRKLDLIVESPIESVGKNAEKEEHILFTQPGMRYCQAQALVHSLMKDITFRQAGTELKEYVTNRILEEVRGRMLEDIILLETTKALGKNYEVFKLKFEQGEFDMVVCDKKNLTCALYEIKHSRECVYEQARHLRDEEKLSVTDYRYGKITGRYVLYLGDDMDTEEGIAYRNAEQFLKNLPQIELVSNLEDGMSEEEEQGMNPIM